MRLSYRSRYKMSEIFELPVEMITDEAISDPRKMDVPKGRVPACRKSHACSRVTCPHFLPHKRRRSCGSLTGNRAHGQQCRAIPCYGVPLNAVEEIKKKRVLKKSK